MGLAPTHHREQHAGVPDPLRRDGRDVIAQHDEIGQLPRGQGALAVVLEARPGGIPGEVGEGRLRAIVSAGSEKFIV